MQEIDELRGRIADIDREIIRLAGKRMQAADRIGEIKAAQGLSVVDLRVEDAVVKRYIEEGAALDISEETCRKLARILIDEAVLRQKNLQ